MVIHSHFSVMHSHHILNIELLIPISRVCVDFCITKMKKKRKKRPYPKSVPSCDPGFEIQRSHLEHCVYLKMTGLTVHVTPDQGGSNLSELHTHCWCHPQQERSEGNRASVVSSFAWAPWMLLDFNSFLWLGHYAVKTHSYLISNPNLNNQDCFSVPFLLPFALVLCLK